MKETTIEDVLKKAAEDYLLKSNYGYVEIGWSEIRNYEIAAFKAGAAFAASLNRQGCRWTKASERLPEGTNGYAKDIVYKQHLDSGTRLKVSTVNQFLDWLKYRMKEKLEWLDESEPCVDRFAELEKENDDLKLKLHIAQLGWTDALQKLKSK